MDSVHAPKRRRVERSPSPTFKLDDDIGAGDAYEPYVPVAQRRQAKLAALTARSSAADAAHAAQRARQEREEREDAEREAERARERARKERTLLQEAQEVHEQRAREDSRKSAGERAAEADEQILAAIASRKKLASDMELAKGIQYTEPLKTSCVGCDSAWTSADATLDGDRHASYVTCRRKIMPESVISIRF
jgi:ATP-dependent RNA helicase DDX41